MTIRAVAWRGRSNDDPGHEISHDRRKVQPMGDVTKYQRRREPGGQCHDQIEMVHSLRSSSTTGIPSLLGATSMHHVWPFSLRATAISSAPDWRISRWKPSSLMSLPK